MFAVLEDKDFVCCIEGYRLCVLYWRIQALCAVLEDTGFVCCIEGYRLCVLYWRIQALCAVLEDTGFVTHSINQLFNL